MNVSKNAMGVSAVPHPRRSRRRSPEPAVPGCRGRWPWRPGIGLPPTGRTVNVGEQNVTTREGAAARSADTPAESHNRHAPTWHFAGIRPRRVTKTHSTATRNVPRQQHVVVEHVYRPVDEPDPVGHG